MANLTKEQKRDATHGFLILIGLIVVGVLIGMLCFGDSGTDTKETDTKEESNNLCETERALQIIKSVDTLLEGGMLKLQEPNSVSFVFYIEPKVWRGLRYEEKQNLIFSLKEYTICRFNEFRVVYLHDAYSGKRVGKSKGLSNPPKIYTD